MSTFASYKHSDLSGRYDSIVIGSGIGGLCTAALLAKSGGERVLVLERHYTAGGFTHAFRRPGYEWDVGVHYIGEVNNPHNAMRRIFDYLSDGQLEWADTGEVYDVIEIDGRRYELPKGREAFRARLHGYFPEEAGAIDRYLALIDRAVWSAQGFFAEKVLPRFLQRSLGSVLRWPALHYARQTTGRVLRELTSHRELRAVLAGQWGDYGLPPEQSSFLMHAMVVKHYLRGAAYPIGGASRIAETIGAGIEARGGKILVRAEVREIVVEAGRAVGVRMADGRELRASKVISDAGIRNTFGRLLQPERSAQQVLSRLSQIQPSAAHLSLYVGLDRSAQELGLGKANRWLYPGPDHDQNLATFLRDPDAPLPLIYISFPSAKDPDFARRHPGHATIEVISVAPYAWFERWSDSQWGRRDEAYHAYKQRLQQRLLSALEAACPSIVGHVSHVELSTPLSTQHFAGHPSGEIYGLAHTAQRFEARELQPRTTIDGLYLTGADVCSAGVGGALMGGVLAASVALKRNLMGVATRGADERASRPTPVAAT